MSRAGASTHNVTCDRCGEIASFGRARFEDWSRLVRFSELPSKHPVELGGYDVCPSCARSLRESTLIRRSR